MIRALSAGSWFFAGYTIGVVVGIVVTILFRE